MLPVLIALVAVVGLAGLGAFARQVMVGRPWRPTGETLLLGAVTNFFDTLGLGSFAPTMAWLRLRKLVPDRTIPPTMYVGHGLPSIVQALIFMTLLGTSVDPWLLTGCTVAMLVGVMLGVRLVGPAPIRVVRSGIAVALVIAGVFYVAANLGVMPASGHEATLSPVDSVIAVAGYLLMGVLINFGIGHYAPSLVMFGLMGLDPHLAFPIMATAGVLGMSGMGLRYLTSSTIDLRTVAGLAFGGVPAVLVAALLVRSAPLVTLRWMVVAVVLYAAIDLVRAALTREEKMSPGIEGT